MVEQVILDNDQTISDSFAWVFGGYQQVARKLGLRSPAEAELKSLWGRRVEDIIAGLFPGTDLEVIFPVVLSIARYSSPPLAPGAIEALSKIRRSGFRLGILSSTSRELFAPQLERAGVDLALFDLLVGGGDTPVVKPDPAVFAPFTAARPPDRLVYVGDSLDDLKAARGAGIGFFALTALSFFSADDFAAAGLPPERILSSIGELPFALLKVS